MKWCAVFFYSASKGKLVPCCSGDEFVQYYDGDYWLRVVAREDGQLSSYGDYYYICVEVEL